MSMVLSGAREGIFDLAGNHQLRYGVQYEDISYNNINQRTGPTFTAPDGTLTATGASISVLPDDTYGKIYRVTRANLNSGRETTQKYLSFFAQDTWQMGRLTLRPGVRYEQQELIGSAPPPNICFEGDSVPGAGDGSGPAKACGFKWSDNWAPRIGLTYDFKGDGRSKLFASYGRFFTKVPNDLAARAMSADAGISRADYFDANLTQPIPNGVEAAGVTQHYNLAGAGASQIAPDSATCRTATCCGSKRRMKPTATSRAQPQPWAMLSVAANGAARTATPPATAAPLRNARRLIDFGFFSI